MEKDDQKDKGMLDLPEKPTKSDVIRAYAAMKYSVEKKIKQENYTYEEIEDMEAILDQARNQCIAMLTKFEKTITAEDSVELMDNEKTIPMNTVELNETKPGCDADTIVIPEHESTEEATNSSQHHEIPDIEAVPDIGNEGMCGFRWLCF